MIKHPVRSFVSWLLLTSFLIAPAFGQRQMEKLGRGVVAVRGSATQVYVGWRLLGNDPDNVAFNLYRSANGGVPLKLNMAPLAATTDYVDTPGALETTAYAYSVQPVVGGVEVPDTYAHAASATATLPAAAPVRQYLSVPLQATPDGAHKVKFCWVGDLDGDGEYDFVVDRYNGAVADQRQFLEAYKRDGTLLWRMNMGPNSTNHYNIEPGSSTVGIGHGDNVTVFDMDGDGKAEVIVRTANGVVFGNGSVLAHGDDRVQFISIVDGMTGAERARATVPNPFLSDGQLNGHMGILYADGVRPSVLLTAKNRRADLGFNGITTVWDYRNGVLSQRWSLSETGFHAPEGHQIRLGDLDNDGKDEYQNIGYALDDDGTPMVSIGEVVHGDRYHTTDIDPDRPGLETFIIQQDNGTGLATALYEAETGAFIKKWYAAGVVDVGRGAVADIDAAHKGYEMFSTQANIYNSKGVQIYAERPFPPETIWWNGDLNREFIGVPGSTGENPVIEAFNPANPGSLSRVYTIYNETAPGVYQAYGGRPAFWGDILGDWREELVAVANDNSELRIYTTKIPATNRLYALMHNPQYRLQTTTKGYVQSSYVDYYLGNGMTPPPPPPMVDAKLVWKGDAAASTWHAGTTSAWLQGAAPAVFASGDSVRFDISGGAAATVTLSGTLSPSALSVYSPSNYTFSGAGSITGSTGLLKAGAGSLTLSGNHPFTGATTVWDGALIVNGDLQQSVVTVWGGTWGGALAEGRTGGRIGGSGRFSQTVTLGYRGAIVPGNGMGNAGTLTLGSGLVAQDGSVLALDLSDDPSGAVNANDRIVVNGNVTLAGTVTLAIEALNGELAPGSYTLLTYNGTLTGGLGNLSVIVPVGTPYTLSAGGGAITLNVPVTRAPAPVTWRGSGSAWDVATSQNWLRNGSPDVYVSGDTVTFDGTGAAQSTVTLTTALPVASIAVAGANSYTLSGPGSITGAGGLTKSGTGVLTIATNNHFTGPTMINGGVITVTELANGGDSSALGSASSALGNWVIDGGALRMTGAQTNTNRRLTLGASGGTLDVSTPGGALQISGQIDGPGSLTKSGPGTLLLASANTYTGGTILSGGTIYLAGVTANVSGLGTGALTLAGGTLTMADVQANENAAWNVIVPAGKSGRINADGRCTLSGSLTGGGDLTYYSGFIRTELAGDWSAFTGRVFFVTDADGGDMRFRTSSGLPLAELNLADDTHAYMAATLVTDASIPLGALSGTADSQLLGSSTAGRTLTWAIGGKNTDSTFAGTIVNGAGITALTKVGTGTLTLTGANTYTGATTVAAGTLMIDGSSSASALTVQSGGKLGANGTITGSVTFNSGSQIHFGNAPLAINGPVNANGTVTVVSPGGRADGTHTVLTATSITGTPTLVYSGPLALGQEAAFTVTSTSITVTFTNIFGRSPTPVTWTGATSSNWDGTSTNWSINLDGTPAQFLPGDTAHFTDSVASPQTITLAANVAPAGLVFTNNTTSYEITSSASASIGGSATVTKSGSAPVTLIGDNTYTGATVVSGGTLAIIGASSSASYTVQPGGGFGGSSVITAPVVFQTGSRLVVTPAGRVVLNGPLTLPSTMTLTAGTYVPDGTYVALETTSLPAATWSYSGPLFIGQSAAISTAGNKVSVTFSGTVSTRSAQPTRWSGAVSAAWTTAVANNWKTTAGGTDTSFLPGDGVTFDDTLTTNPIITAANAVFPSSVTFANDTTPYRINSTNGGISGAITLVKNGSGTATLAGANNYTGGTVINAGVLAMGDDAANSGGTGPGPITLNGGTFRYLNSTGSFTATPQSFIVPAGANARIEGDGRSGVTGTLTGAGTLEFVTNFIRLEMNGNWSAFAGRLNFTTPSSGELRLGNANPGFPNADVYLGSGVKLHWTAALGANVTVPIGALSGAEGANLSGTATGARTIFWTVGARNLDSTFAGAITNSSGPSALSKVGTGTLTLSGNNTYTGTTVVNAGTLLITGASANTGVTTVNGGTLAISGSLANASSVEIKAGATLNITGTLTTGTLTIRAGAQLTGGGTINANVVNEGLIALSGAGTNLTINGNFTNSGVIRLVRGAGLAHNLGTFTNTGTLDVITAGATNLPLTDANRIIDATSIRASSLTWSPGEPAVLTLLAFGGHTFQLQRTTDLASGTWENVGPIVQGSGVNHSFEDSAPPANAPRLFYRVVVDP